VIPATLIATTRRRARVIWSAPQHGSERPRADVQIVLPRAAQIPTGLQVALPLSMIVAVVAEMRWAARPRRRDDDGVALRRFARRVRRHVEIAIVGYVLIKAMRSCAGGC